MHDIIVLSVELGIMLIAFFAGRYLLPNIPQSVKETFCSLSEWAAAFVVWARDFMQKSTGAEKMAAVVEQLKLIAEKNGIEVTEEQLTAIAQKAYDSMMAGKKEAEIKEAAVTAAADPQATFYKIGSRAVAKGSTVIINTGTKEAEGVTAVATDNVPEGALEENPDGTINTYNESGEKVGTITAKEAEKLAAEVTKILIEDKD